jgi:quinol monooxygenase YgiN
MYALIITFELNDLSAEAYRAQCEQVAPHFASLPGLTAKIWLADPAANTYGGIYLWRDREALEQYLVSDTFGSLVANPRFTNLRTRDFPVLDGVTMATWPAGALVAGDAVSRF